MPPLDEDARAEVLAMIREASRTHERRRRRDARRAPARVQDAVAQHQRMVILPGAVRSRYCYAFLFGEDGSATWRLPIRKAALEDFLSECVAQDPGSDLEGASVELRGDFPLTLE